MEKSIVAKVPGSSTAADEGGFVQGEVKTQHEHVEDGTHRKLEDNAYVQNKYNSYKDEVMMRSYLTNLASTLRRTRLPTVVVPP